MHNNFPGIVGEEREWYPLQRLNSVPRRLLEMQTTPPHRHPALISAHEPILVVTMPGVVVATGQNSRFGSGSGSNPEPDRCNGFPPKSRRLKSTMWARIKYLSSDRIVT